MVFQYLRTRGKSLFTESVHQQATSILSNIGTLGKSEHICDWFGTFIDPQCSQILAPWESLNIFAIGLELLTSDGCIWEGLKSTRLRIPYWCPPRYIVPHIGKVLPLLPVPEVFIVTIIHDMFIIILSLPWLSAQSGDALLFWQSKPDCGQESASGRRSPPTAWTPRGKGWRPETENAWYYKETTILLVTLSLTRGSMLTLWATVQMLKFCRSWPNSDVAQYR